MLFRKIALASFLALVPIAVLAQSGSGPNPKTWYIVRDNGTCEQVSIDLDRAAQQLEIQGGQGTATSVSEENANDFSALTDGGTLASINMGTDESNETSKELLTSTLEDCQIIVSPENQSQIFDYILTNGLNH